MDIKLLFATHLALSQLNMNQTMLAQANYVSENT